MTYLIIALVILLAVTPIFWLKPTPRQRQLEALRYAAQRAGFQVRLAARPGARVGPPRLDVALYFLPWTRPIDQRDPEASRWTLVGQSFEGQWSPWEGWRWLTPGPKSLRAAIAEVLPLMPESACALEASSLGIGFYWDERPADPEAVLPVMLPALERLRSAVEASPVQKVEAKYE